MEIDARCYPDGMNRRAFDDLLTRLQDPDERVRLDAVRGAPALEDSRVLFTLLNFSKGLDPQSDLCTAVSEALHCLRDPRSGAPDRTEFLYTYIGPDSDLRRADQPGRAVIVSDPSALGAAFLREERHGTLDYGLFVVLPEDRIHPFDGACRLVVAPWRTEHYQAARGADVLAAGVVGIRAGRIEEITNQSGGYYPAPSSFAWVRRSCERVGIPLPASGYTSEWPPDGFLAEGVLSRFPLYR